MRMADCTTSGYVAVNMWQSTTVGCALAAGTNVATRTKNSFRRILSPDGVRIEGRKRRLCWNRETRAIAIGKSRER
jgi:hypothetical protein